jgi:outer membrane immunogenic protein
MKHVLLAGIALTVFTTCQAIAADMLVRKPILKAPPAPVAAAYDWSGFYLGVHGGGAWARKQFTDVTLDPLNDGTLEDGGWLAGGQLGFNWQVGATVLGLEVDGSAADVRGERQSLAFPDDRIASETTALGTIAVRAGYAVNNLLFYAKGGAAWAHDKHTLIDAPGDAPRAVAATFGDTHWGWMVGGGIEYGFAPNWSLKAEYNYLDFGTQTFRDVVCTPFCDLNTFDETVAQRIHVVKLGLNYRFGGSAPIAARY